MGYATHESADPATALAEADRHKTFAPGLRAEDHLVAVFEESPRFARRKRDRLFPVQREFDQAAPAGRSRRGNRAAAEEIAGCRLHPPQV